MSEPVWLQDDPVDPPLIDVPPRPTTDEEIAALPILKIERVDEHSFLDGDPFCMDCGCLYGEATKHRCGPT